MSKTIRRVLIFAVLLGILRLIFPPLTDLGYTTPAPDVSLQVMIKKRGGLDPVRIYLETPENLPLEPISAALCENLVADQVAGLLPVEGISDSGSYRITFMKGGRYFYRVLSKEAFEYSYTPDGCELKET